jgi:poly-beta-hydroxyalkanoate depolymerase
MIPHDASAIALRAAARAFRPKKALTVSEWADANRILAEEGSADLIFSRKACSDIAVRATPTT